MASPPSSSTTALASHPLLWRGKQVEHRIPTLSTGHVALDDALPGRGWPLGAVTELVNETAGCGEMSLLLPALARMSRENHWISMIDPPWIPYPAALHGYGLALEKLLLIRTQNRGESLWACEQVVRGLSGGAVLAWPNALSFGELRRLQLAAEHTQKAVFLFRDRQAASASSPAALRLQLTANEGDLQIRVLKCRGQRPAASIRIRRPQLLQPLMPPRVSASGSSKRSSSASERPVVSLATSRINRPSL
ncbi:MAG TPA: translesion DNA synthesis-associated protein ImuA [Xanthomonadales bacterium]